MKVPGSVRQIFQQQRQANEPLKEKVDSKLRGLKRATWHYESRLKEEQSFALKLESGRVPDPAALEDFFACTLVVRNSSEIADAEKLLTSHFDVQYRRPEADDKTHKNPNQFPFDDLRLYVRWRDDLALPRTGLTGITFEAQVKTFLQHAWSIATHDLVYKADSVSWSKERIAFQIKAMLEHAEISIQEADRLSECTMIAKEDRTTAQLRQCISLLDSIWNKADLPRDVRRLAENIVELTKLMRVDLKDLEQALLAERRDGGGSLPQNLSPYNVALKALIRSFPEKFKQAVGKDNRANDSRKKILIPMELEIPDSLGITDFTNAVRTSTNAQDHGKVL